MDGPAIFSQRTSVEANPQINTSKGCGDDFLEDGIQKTLTSSPNSLSLRKVPKRKYPATTLAHAIAATSSSLPRRGGRSAERCKKKAIRMNLHNPHQSVSLSKSTPKEPRKLAPSVKGGTPETKYLDEMYVWN